MEKIAILGPAGAGKTTLAVNLEHKLNLNAIYLDRLFWKIDWNGETKDAWKRESKEKRLEILDNLVREKQWIIEGNYISSSESRLKAADTIIFLDINPSICLWRLLNRHRLMSRLAGLILNQKRELQEFRRRDLPEGSIDKLSLLCIMKVIFFPFLGRRKLINKLEDCILQSIPPKVFFWFHSPKEVEDFLAHLEFQTEEELRYSMTLTFEGKRRLALARG